MPVLQCPRCDTVVAWSGRRLGFDCPGDHAGFRPLRLDVDRDLATGLNARGIDVHLTGYEDDLRGGRPERDWIAVNGAKGR